MAAKAFESSWPLTQKTRRYQLRRQLSYTTTTRGTICTFICELKPQVSNWEHVLGLRQGSSVPMHRTMDTATFSLYRSMGCHTFVPLCRAVWWTLWLAFQHCSEGCFINGMILNINLILNIRMVASPWKHETTGNMRIDMYFLESALSSTMLLGPGCILMGGIMHCPPKPVKSEEPWFDRGLAWPPPPWAFPVLSAFSILCQEFPSIPISCHLSARHSVRFWGPKIW